MNTAAADLHNEYTRDQAARQTGQIFGVVMTDYDRETDTATMVYYKPGAWLLEDAQAWYLLVATGNGFYPLPLIDELPRETRIAAYRCMYRTGLKPSQCTAIIARLTGKEN